jgi:RNA methyltransferase, TrmH family
MAQPLETITSTQNNKIKLARKLHDKRQREREGLFVVDYARDLARALANGYQVEFALFCPALATTEEAAILATLPTAYEVAADLMAKASYRQNPGGLIAVMQQKALANADDVKALVADYVLGLVALEKPGNIGALLRTADAASFTAILLIDTALDIYNPNIIRSSTGASFLGNLYALTSHQAQALLHERGYQVLSAHLEGDVGLYDVDFRHKSAVILGKEDTGLPQTWVDACDHLVKIPMHGQLSDSLNVSVSGAVFMYEALRQQQLGDGF